MGCKCGCEYWVAKMRAFRVFVDLCLFGFCHGSLAAYIGDANGSKRIGWMDGILLLGKGIGYL